MPNETMLNSGELLSQLLDNITDKIYFKDRESRFILVNPAFSNTLGIAPDDLLGKTDFDLFTSEHARPAFSAEQQMLKTGRPLLGLEEKETWPDGHETWVSTTKMPLCDSSGAIIGTFGISRDITEHKLNEIKLHQYARRLTQINKQLEEELRMAANLQNAFLPQVYPDFPASSEKTSVQFFHRYIANAQVSGDLCSIKKLSDTEAGMVICDVMGHGVRAALVTAILHTILGNLMQRNLPPGEFLTELNRQLHPVLQSQDNFIFVTASYLILNTQTGELIGSSAGHTLPILIRKQDDPVVTPLHAMAQVNGPALAVMDHFEYQTVSAQLRPGDTLLMFTDGLVEESNDTREEFGENRVLAILEQHPENDPKDVCDILLHAITQFRDGTQFDDDVCLLAFRWNGSST